MRFNQDEVRAMGRTASGVRGIKLKEGDAVVSAVLARDDHQLCLITTSGYGKRTDFAEFNPKHRGGQGVTAIKINEQKGQVVGARMVDPDDDLMLIASNGVVIRIPVEDISVQGAYATGVKIMTLKGDDEVVAVTQVSVSDEDEDGDAADGDAADGEAEVDAGDGQSDDTNPTDASPTDESSAPDAALEGESGLDEEE